MSPRDAVRRRVLRAASLLALCPPLPAVAQPEPDDWNHRTFVTSDGVHLHAIERFPRSAVASRALTVLLVPGWCMPATVWRGQIEALGARWRTIALDPRGQGESEIPAQGYDADRRGDDIAELRNSLGRTVVVAWSLAALEALQAVSRHGSDGIAGLVLVDSSVGEPPVPPPSTGFLQSLRSDRERTVNDFVHAVFGGQPEDELQEIVRLALRMPLEASVSLLSDPRPREHWREIARGFDRPLAYLVSEQFRAQGESLVEARPQTTFEVFEHSGHAIFADEPERFNTLLASWIEGLG